MKNIIITGGSGFVGTNLISLLSSTKEYAPYNLDIRKPQKAEQKKHWAKVDIRNAEQIESAFKKIKPFAVIHLAAHHYIPWCEEFPAETIHTNVVGTQNIAIATKKYRTRKFIYASSAAVYGAYDTPCKESFPLKPNNIYGVTKVVGEKIIQDIIPDISHIARFFNIVGPYDKTAHLFPEILTQLSQTPKIELGNTATVRDYIHVNDICAMLVSLLTVKTPQLLNLGTGKGKTALDLVKVAEVGLNTHAKVSINKARKRAVDTPFLVSNISKMNSLFPHLDLTDEGLWCYNV